MQPIPHPLNLRILGQAGALCVFHGIFELESVPSGRLSDVQCVVNLYCKSEDKP